MPRTPPPLSADAAALLADMNAAMTALQGRRRDNAQRRREWQALKRDNAPSSLGGSMSGVMFENMLMGLLVESLFGMPVFSGLDLSDETVRSLGFLGTAMHHDMTEKKGADDKQNDPDRDPILDEFISMAALDGQKARLDNADARHAAQMAELQQLKRLIMVLMAAMAAQNRDKARKRDADLVPDVLRDPKMARFKQNRHSMACIKTLFKRQVAQVAVVPRALNAA